ncbi:unnamed protein product [Rangifer tarandus platyrhynchus]|uniref:Uncharacterized protein n=1 Tax=Rangifer tarandus platyrhynchus TaxID=3082113 RepID=A0ABN9A1D1_RANTA|nr:unnamed protein product [Rangifer tarandus platyrhynchus]
MQSFISPVTKAILVALFIFAILLILAREPGAGPAPVGRSSPGLAGQREALAGDRSGGPAPAWGALGPSERLGTLAIGHPLRSGPGFPPTPSPWLAGKPVESAPCALLAFPGTPKVGGAGANPLAGGFLPASPLSTRDSEKGKLCPTPVLREQVCDLNKDLVSKNIAKKKKRPSGAFLYRKNVPAAPKASSGNEVNALVGALMTAPPGSARRAPACLSELGGALRHQASSPLPPPGPQARLLRERSLAMPPTDPKPPRPLPGGRPFTASRLQGPFWRQRELTPPPARGAGTRADHILQVP